jgi:hypothetical protein
MEKPARYPRPASYRKLLASQVTHPASLRTLPASHGMEKPADFHVRRGAGSIRRSGEASSGLLDASGKAPDGEISWFPRPASCRIHQADCWMRPVRRRIEKPAGFHVQRAAGCSRRSGDASNGLLDAAGEAPDGETGRFPRPASCRMHPAGRVTHPMGRRKPQRAR